jgi:hypothetical protein
LEYRILKRSMGRLDKRDTKRLEDSESNLNIREKLEDKRLLLNHEEKSSAQVNILGAVSAFPHGP